MHSSNQTPVRFFAGFMGFASAELNSPPKEAVEIREVPRYTLPLQIAWKCAGVSAVLWFSTLLSAQPGVTFSPTSLSFGNHVIGVRSSAQSNHAYQYWNFFPVIECH